MASFLFITVRKHHAEHQLICVNKACGTFSIAFGIRSIPTNVSLSI